MRTLDHHRAFKAIILERHDLSQDSEAIDDIRNVLEQEFAEIRRVHVIGLTSVLTGPADWLSTFLLTDHRDISSMRRR